MTNLAGVLQNHEPSIKQHHSWKFLSGIHKVASTNASDGSKQLKRKAKQLKISEQSIHHMQARRGFWSILLLILRKKLHNKQVT